MIGKNQNKPQNRLSNKKEIIKKKKFLAFNMGMGFLMIVPFDISEEVANFVNGNIVGKIVEKGIKIDNLEIE